MYENKILVTGAAGFIGFHVCKKLLELGHMVIGIDNLNNYYDINLKYKRIEILLANKNFNFYKIDIIKKEEVFDLFRFDNIRYVIHLAAQAGVRYSLQNPDAYIDSNICGFLTILESCRNYPVKHLVYASSSSVYGGNTKTPFAEEDRVDTPLSLYAATKKSDELLAYSYASLFGFPVTGLRFFTVYGEWGRPDMAIYIFTKCILENRPIELYNYGRMKRDFTYVNDVVEGIIKVMLKPLDVSKSNGTMNNQVPAQVFNIGNNNPVELGRLIEILEYKLGKKAIKKLLPMQPGDVPSTCADIKKLKEYIDFTPNTSIEVGLSRFVDWYLKTYTSAPSKTLKSTVYAKRNITSRQREQKQ